MISLNTTIHPTDERDANPVLITTVIDDLVGFICLVVIVTETSCR